MLKERILEVFEFTKSESPYRKANRGWINKDIFFDLSPSTDTYKKLNEAAKITLFWAPINSLLSNIFIITILCSTIVFISVSFAKGRLDINLFDNSRNKNIVKVDEYKDLNITRLNEIDSTNLINTKNIELKDIDKSNKISSLEDDLNNADEKIINEKIDKKDLSTKENKSNNDVKILKNTNPKSNFI